MKAYNSVILFLFSVFSISAQTTVVVKTDTIATDTVTVRKVNIQDYLPPLSLIIDSAMANAPELQYHDALVKTSEYDVVLEKKSWSKDFGVTVGYTWSYGNQILSNTQVLGSEINEDQTRTSTFSTISLNVPLSTWYGRNDRINRAEAYRQTQLAKYEEMERQVRERVIETYSRLLLLQDMMEIIAEAKETTELISQTAEERFRDGETSLEELGKAADLRAQYSTRYAELKTEFSNTYQALERMAGVPFSKFNTTNYIVE